MTKYYTVLRTPPPRLAVGNPLARHLAVRQRWCKQYGASRVGALLSRGASYTEIRASGASNSSSTYAAGCQDAATDHSLMRREAITVEPRHAGMIGRFRSVSRIGLLLPGGLSGRR